MTVAEKLKSQGINALVELVMRMEDEWLSSVMAKVMPADLFLRAYGNFACKLDVAQWMEKEGYHVALHPCGKKELRRFDEVIATFSPPIRKIVVSNVGHPLSFSVKP